MLGFSITFVVAEVIPLIMITLFTVIAIDLKGATYSVWLLNSQTIAVGAIAPFVGTLSDLLGRRWFTLISLCFTVVGMIILGTTKNISGAIAAQVITGIGIVRLSPSSAAANY